MTMKLPCFLLGVAVASASTLLVACGSDDDDATKATSDASVDAARAADATSLDSAVTLDAADAPDSAACAADAAQLASECLEGDPCSCSDVAGLAATCVDTTFTCPAGYTRADRCLGFPPAYPHDACEAYLDGGPFPGTTPDAGDGGDASDGASR
jgi:hypothetical protein